MKKPGEKLSFLQRIIRGAVGKRYVIKHYRYAIIKTKYPDMTKIIASPGQRKCRNLFLEAVAYAKTVMADKEKKKAWQKRLRRRNGVWNEAVKYYLLKEKHAKQRAELLTGQLIRQAFSNEQSPIGASIRLCSPGKAETRSLEPPQQFRKKALNNHYCPGKILILS